MYVNSDKKLPPLPPPPYPPLPLRFGVAFPRPWLRKKNKQTKKSFWEYHTSVCVLFCQ